MTDKDLPAVDLVVEADGWDMVGEIRPAVCRAVTAACVAAGHVPAEGSEVGVLLTDDARMRELNLRWRGIDRPTNVLSFPAGPAGGSVPLLVGDIVLAYETLEREAREAEKPLAHHFAHLVVHGFLHLLGYDHETAREAEVMESLERRALSGLAIDDPYA